MKKALYLGFAALAAFAFTACQKEAGVNASKKNMVTVTLTAQKAGDETRTAAVEEETKVSYEWTAEDVENLKVCVVGEDADGKEVLTPVEDRVVSVSSDNKVLTVTATVEAGSTLRTAVSNAWTGSNKPKVNVNQNPKTDNYDPGADVLVAEDVTVDGLDEALLDFSRPVAISKMTLKNLVAGEKIHEISVTSDKDIAGYYENGAMKGQAKAITLAYDNVEVGENGEFPVYFVTMPNAANTLTVVVKSDQFVYTKTFGPVNFTVGKFSKFGVKLPAGEPVVDTDYTGDWVITGVNGEKAFAAPAYVSGNNLPALGVTLDVENEKITTTKVNEIKMHFEKMTEGDYAGLYTIKDASGNYLYAASSSANQLKGAPTLDGADYYWAVEEETDGTFSIKASKSDNRNVMQFNPGNSIFSCYGSASQKPVTLYPYSWVEEEPGIQPSGTGTLEDPFNVPAVYQWVDENLASGDVTDEDYYFTGIISSIKYTFSAQYGTATFNVSADGTTSETQFTCYSVFYLGNQAWVDGNTQIKVGDEVVICGKLTNYNGTYETASKKAYIYSLNGITGNEEYTITVAPAENGEVEASASKAKQGTEITLTITPDTGYILNTLTVVDASNNPVTVTDNTFTMPASNVTVTATFREKTAGAITATIKFGTNDVKVDAESVTGKDDQENEWTITTEGTSSFTPSAEYCQIGSSKKPATSITFTTTLPEGITKVDALSITLGGFSGTAGDVTLDVEGTTIGEGSLSGTSDVTVSSTTSADGRTITITVDNIAKGVKVYNIVAEYE